MSSGPTHIGEIREKFSVIRVRWDADYRSKLDQLSWPYSGGGCHRLAHVQTGTATKQIMISYLTMADNSISM